MKYLFGDTDIAARRLEVLAEVFAGPTRAFLLEMVPDRPRLAVDLGCGPGHTTRFLANVLACDQTVGLDNSEHFLSLARKTATERVSFLLHDVTSVPFPVEPADLIYCRYLITHLMDPQSVIRQWISQIRPQGLLLMEETEAMDTDNAVFSAYIDIVTAMLYHQANELYVGPVLDSLEGSDSLIKRASQVRRLAVANRRAATMFFLNLQSWKRQPFIQANYSPAVIDKLEADLCALSQQSGDESEIEWGIRQIVFRREGD